MRDDDFQTDVECAARTVGAIAFELEDMLSRLPGINTPDLAKDHPHELLALWSALSQARTAMLDIEEAARDLRIARSGIPLAEEAA